MNAVDEVLRFLGEVVLYGGGSATVAFLLFQYLGKGWIDARFAERLEAFKHEQAKELQRMKVEVESVLSGALKVSVQPSRLDSRRSFKEGVHLFRRWTPWRRGQGRQGGGTQMS